MVDLRQHLRAPVDVPVEYVLKGTTERASGRARDISLGGMYVETAILPRFGVELIVHLIFPGQKLSFAIPAVVRWTRPGNGMGLQFGLLGARETHAITELTRASND